MSVGSNTDGVATILLLRFSSLGDCVLLSGVINQIVHDHPQARLIVATKAAFADLFDADPRIHEVIKLTDEHRGLQGLWRYAQKLKAVSADLVLDFHNTLRAKILRFMVSKPQWRSLPKLTFLRRIRVLVHSKQQFPHITARYGSLLPHNHRRPLPPTYPHITVENQRKGVALVPGAAWATKQWPLQRYLEVATTLLDKGHAVTVLGGAKEQLFAPDCKKIAQIYPQSFEYRFENTAFQPLLATLAGFRCVVANDTGLMHMATAVGTPVVAIFGPTTPSLGFAPLGPHDTVLWQDQVCNPCTLHGSNRCPKKHWNCMQNLQVAQVNEAVAAILEIQ